MIILKSLLTAIVLIVFLLTLSCGDESLALLEKGQAQYKEGKYEEAVKSYDKALEIDPNNPNVWCNKGLALSKLSKWDEAVKCYDKTLEITPSNSLAKTSREDAIKALGKTAPAGGSGGASVNPFDTGGILNKANNAAGGAQQQNQ